MASIAFFITEKPIPKHTYTVIRKVERNLYIRAIDVSDGEAVDSICNADAFTLPGETLLNTYEIDEATEMSAADGNAELDYQVLWHRSLRAVELTEKDPHQFSSRPCGTCAEITHLIGRSFGCAQKNRPQPKG